MTKNTHAFLLFFILQLLSVVAISQTTCTQKNVSGVTNNYGIKSTTVCNYTNNYVLQDYNRNIFVWNEAGNPSICNPNLNVAYQNNNGFFETDTLAFTAYWAAQKCYQYLQDSLNWQGLNGTNDSIQITIVDQNTFGYCVGGKNVFIGKDKKATIDIIAHEIFHGVTGASANFDGDLQPAALGEAASDIFGEVIENYIIGTNDWLFDPLFNERDKRSFINPLIYGDAKTYLGENWDYGYGSEYTNCGVVNHWFYLLSEQTDIYTAFNIFFKAVTENLCSTANFADARYATIKATKQIYVNNNSILQKVKTAWDNVGVFEVDFIDVNSTIFRITDNRDSFNYRNIFTNGIINTQNSSNKTIDIIISNSAVLNQGFTVHQSTNFSIDIKNCDETITF